MRFSRRSLAAGVLASLAASTTFAQSVLPSPTVDEGWRGPSRSPARRVSAERAPGRLDRNVRTADFRADWDAAPEAPGTRLEASDLRGVSPASTTAQRPFDRLFRRGRFAQAPAATPADLPPTLNVPDLPAGAAPQQPPVGSQILDAPPLIDQGFALQPGGRCPPANYLYAPGQAGDPYAARAGFISPIPQPVTPPAGAFRGVFQDAPAQAPGAVAPPGFYLGRTLLGSPKLYAPRQPLRNAIRFLTP